MQSNNHMKHPLGNERKWKQVKKNMQPSGYRIEFGTGMRPESHERYGQKNMNKTFSVSKRTRAHPNKPSQKHFQKNMAYKLFVFSFIDHRLIV